jgi:hypothetical protein
MHKLSVSTTQKWLITKSFVIGQALKGNLHDTFSIKRKRNLNINILYLLFRFYNKTIALNQQSWDWLVYFPANTLTALMVVVRATTDW